MAAIVRGSAFPLVAPLGFGVPGFLAVQTLHALSTGLILIGLQEPMAEVVPEERIGAAQGVAFFANGLSMAAVTLVSGRLYESIGVSVFYVTAVVALVGVTLILVASRSSPQIRNRG